MSICLAHVSDLHVHANPQKNAATKALLERIHATYFQPADGGGQKTYLLVTGDIVDDGEAEQYARAVELLSPFKGSLLCCPGNHCAGPLGNFYREESLKLFEQHLGPLAVPVSHGLSVPNIEKEPVQHKLSDGGDTRLITIGLNSCRETESPTDFACGEIGESQMTALRALLSHPEAAGLPNVVYLHHKPLPFHAFGEYETMRLKDADSLLRLVEWHSNVVAFGHSGANRVTRHEQGSLSTAFHHVTHFADANSCVESQAWIEMVFNGTGAPQIRQRS